jgi:hypothetical protein
VRLTVVEMTQLIGIFYLLTARRELEQLLGFVEASAAYQLPAESFLCYSIIVIGNRQITCSASREWFCAGPAGYLLAIRDHSLWYFKILNRAREKDSRMIYS